MGLIFWRYSFYASLLFVIIGLRYTVLAFISPSATFNSYSIHFRLSSIFNATIPYRSAPYRIVYNPHIAAIKWMKINQLVNVRYAIVSIICSTHIYAIYYSTIYPIHMYKKMYNVWYRHIGSGTEVLLCNPYACTWTNWCS